MKVKTADLIGPALNWAVATLMGYANLHTSGHRDSLGVLMMDPPRVEYGAIDFSDLNFTHDWSQGGPIIERECVSLCPDEFRTGDDRWCAVMTNEAVGYEAFGPTPLIAAMRCFVASKLGDEVDVSEMLA